MAVLTAERHQLTRTDTRVQTCARDTPEIANQKVTLVFIGRELVIGCFWVLCGRSGMQGRKSAFLFALPLR